MLYKEKNLHPCLAARTFILCPSRPLISSTKNFVFYTGFMNYDTPSFSLLKRSCLLRISAAFLCCFFAWLSQAQKRWDTWHFSVHYGLKINQCTDATALQDVMIGEGAGTCSISDTSGNLLFVSNGNAVRNRNGQMMPNGELTGGWTGGVYYYQGPIFVPHPANDSLYYLFHVKRSNLFANGDFETEFHYSIVNKNLDNGKGDVIVKEKKLYRLTTEATAAVQHENKKDYWVVSHKTGSDSFVVFKVTGAGLDTVPRYYKVGPAFESGWRDRQVVIKFSPDQKKMVISRNLRDPNPNRDRNGGFDLYDFDPATGAISNPIAIRSGFVTEVPNSAGRYFSTGAEFSPNSKLLYISTWDRLYQFDIDLHDSATINNSRYLVSPTDIYSYGFGHIQMGSNGKIYVAKFYSNGYLAIINNPNNKGAACGYNLNAVQFPNVNWTTYRIPGFGLGNCIQPYLRRPGYASSDLLFSTACASDPVHFSVRNVEADSIKWNFGDPAGNTPNEITALQPVHQYNTPGTYQVRAIVYSACATDTVNNTLTLAANNFSLGADTIICYGQSIVLRPSPGATAYVWNNGSTADTLTANTTGVYWVNINRGGCTKTDSIQVTVISQPPLDLGSDTAVCIDSVLTLDVKNPLIATYNWSTGQTAGNITISLPGDYHVTVTGTNGCTNSDTIKLTNTTLPVFNLGTDTSLCSRDSLVYNINEPEVYATWQNGITANQYSIFSSGTYSVQLNKTGCIKRDTVNVLFKPLPAVYLGTDTALCLGQLLSLNAGSGNDLYQWQDGSGNLLYEVNGPGLYHVKVQNEGCTSSDSILVSYHSKPLSYIGLDTIACNGSAFSLNAFWYNASYLWNNGSTSQYFQVTHPGAYNVTVTNFCGDTTLYKNVAWEACETSFTAYNAFSPNGDGVNDIWLPKLSGRYLNYRLQIFNRWGRLVHQGNALAPWDGVENGSMVSSGTYYFVVTYLDIPRNRKLVHSGFLLVTR